MNLNYFKNTIGVLFMLILLLCSQSVKAQVVFSETFDESDESTIGVDNANGVSWSTTCATCIDAGDFFKVQGGQLVGQDSNGPATWETDVIDISSCDFIDISFLLKEEGTMEACGTGCTSVDWVQLEYNINNTGWQTPSNSTFCGGGCADLNVIQSDDITGGETNYATGCIQSGNTLQVRISVQAWAASERWIIDDFEVSCSTGPEVNAGLDQQSCGENITLTATNPDNADITWNNGVTNGVSFPPLNGINNYVVYADLGGCVATDTVVVSAFSPPSFNISSSNPTTCGGNDGTIIIDGLENTTDYEVTYFDGTAQGPNVLTTNLNGEIVLPNLSAGTYTNFEVELNGCLTTDNQNIVLTDPNAPTVNAGPDQFVCTGENIELNASNPDGANISWDNGVNNGVSFQAINGNVVYTVTANLNGCISTDIVEVTGTTPPSIDAGVNQIVCENTSVTLSAINPDMANISWDNGVTDGATFTPGVGVVNYTVTAELNGCIVTDMMTLTVNEVPNFTVLPLNPITCNGNDGKIIIYGLDANSNYDLVYDNDMVVGPISVNSDANGEVEITGLNQGVYTDFTISNSGCSSTVTETLTLTDPPIPSVYAGDDIMVCLGDDVILTATNPDNGTITWNNGVQDGVSFQALADQVYTVTVEKNNCFNTDELNITTLLAPSVYGGEDMNICVGDSIILLAENPNNGVLSWSNNVIDGQLFAPQFSESYVVTASIGNCVNSDTVDVYVNQGPNAAFTFNPNNPTVENTEVQFTPLNANSASETYNWSFGDNFYATNAAPTHFYPETGNVTYKVSLIVTDSLGCTDSSYNYITVDDILLYYIPNAFTPDGDLINNEFKPIFTSGFDPYDYHLIIFNRWGERIFESFNSQVGWDGTYGGGNKVAEGVYVYTISFGNLKNDERKNVTGTVTLLK